MMSTCRLGTADAGDYEAPTLGAPETSANPVATFDVEPSGPPPAGGSDAATLDLEPSTPPVVADGSVEAL
jgi:hypothetical protein